jgi:tRNA 2-thiouridine synthesizing protein C
MKKIAIINTSASFNGPAPRESLDLALIFGAFEQQVTVFFVDDGVYQLIGQQQPELIGRKDYLSTMKALEIYDIEHIVGCEDDMLERGVQTDNLSMTVDIQPANVIAAMIRNFDHVVTM